MLEGPPYLAIEAIVARTCMTDGLVAPLGVALEWAGDGSPGKVVDGALPSLLAPLGVSAGHDTGGRVVDGKGLWPTPSRDSMSPRVGLSCPLSNVQRRGSRTTRRVWAFWSIRRRSAQGRPGIGLIGGDHSVEGALAVRAFARSQRNASRSTGDGRLGLAVKHLRRLRDRESVAGDRPALATAGVSRRAETLVVRSQQGRRPLGRLELRRARRQAKVSPPWWRRAGPGRGARASSSTGPSPFAGPGPAGQREVPRLEIWRPSPGATARAVARDHIGGGTWRNPGWRARCRGAGRTRERARARREAASRQRHQSGAQRPALCSSSQW